MKCVKIFGSKFSKRYIKEKDGLWLGFDEDNYLNSIIVEEDKFSEEEIEELVEQYRKWTRAYINDLPDQAFAYIEPCYKRGETKNKNARHLPHHNEKVKDPNENSTVDIPHLRNALARVNQIKPICPDTNREKAINTAKRHLMKHARALLKTYQEKQSKFSNVERVFLEEIEKLLGE